MGYKPVPTKKFIKWLKKRGLVYIRTESSHDIWDYPPNSGKTLLRPVTIRDKDKDIPSLHVFTNLKTLGIDYKTFEKEIKRL